MPICPKTEPKIKLWTYRRIIKCESQTYLYCWEITNICMNVPQKYTLRHPHNWLVRTKVNISLQPTARRIYVNFWLYRLENVHCVTWYALTQFITTILKNIQTQNLSFSAACTTVLRWIENFENLRNVENWTGCWCPPISKWKEQTGTSYLLKSRTTSLRKAVADIGVLNSSIWKTLKKTSSHVSVQNFKSTSFPATIFGSTIGLLSNVYAQHVSQFLDFYVGFFFDDCDFRS